MLSEVLSAVLTAVSTAVAAPDSDAERVVVLIDGPSGAGKSTLADALRLHWPSEAVPTLVRLDDIYPGWGGLDAAIGMVTGMLHERARGRPARWQRHDWETGHGAEWHEVAPEHPLIVEGCGALALGNRGLADVRVWLDADDVIRKQRALARDGGVFEEHWDQWQADWQDYRDREKPERQATLRLNGGAARSRLDV